MKKYLRLMRIKHYCKNILVFVPLVFSKLFFVKQHFVNNLLGFIAFSLMTSVVYIVNDINDLESDKKHLIKCKRPLPAGLITVTKAKILATVLFVFSIIINAFTKSNLFISTNLLLAYYLLNILYSKHYKHVPIIDIAILASGFVIRVLYGSAVVNILISSWLYLTIITLSLYLVLGKRRNEIVKQGSSTRRVLKKYNYNFLDKNMYLYLALTIGFYSMWCVDSKTITSFGKSIVYTVPLVMLICLKYSLAVEGDSEGDPVEVVFSDKIMLLLIASYAMLMFSIIYYKPLHNIVIVTMT